MLFLIALPFFGKVELFIKCRKGRGIICFSFSSNLKLRCKIEWMNGTAIRAKNRLRCQLSQPFTGKDQFWGNTFLFSFFSNSSVLLLMLHFSISPTELPFYVRGILGFSPSHGRMILQGADGQGVMSSKDGRRMELMEIVPTDIELAKGVPGFQASEVPTVQWRDTTYEGELTTSRYVASWN